MKKYSLFVFGCNREAWLHGKPKIDSIGNMQSLEVIYIPLYIPKVKPFVSKKFIHKLQSICLECMKGISKKKRKYI
jgi:hypothetical protein